MSVVLTILAILGWTLFALTILVGILLNLVGLFGNWLILLAVGCAYAFSGFDYFGPYTLGILLGLALLGEVLETTAAGYGAAKFGGGKGSIVAAIVGAILGGILFTPIIPIPLVGTVIGACIGSFAAATLYELQRQEHGVDGAVRVGFGAALGKVAGLFAKSFVGFAMLGVAAWNF